MNSNDPDMGKMRKVWMEMGKALGMDKPQSDTDDLDKMHTDLDRLRLRYMTGRDWSVVAAVVFTVLLFLMPSLNDEHRLPVAVTFAVIMSANAYALNWFQRGIGKINPLTMSISQVSSMARYYKKSHLKYVLSGMLVAILWIEYFMYATDRSFGSIAIGAVIGAICGLYSLWKYLKDYRNLSE